MNEIPPNQDQADEVDNRYRRESALDPSRPSESVRRAVLEHATRLAAERLAKNGAAQVGAGRPAARCANGGRLRPIRDKRTGLSILIGSWATLALYTCAT